MHSKITWYKCPNDLIYFGDYCSRLFLNNECFRSCFLARDEAWTWGTAACCAPSDPLLVWAFCGSIPDQFCWMVHFFRTYWKEQSWKKKKKVDWISINTIHEKVLIIETAQQNHPVQKKKGGKDHVPCKMSKCYSYMPCVFLPVPAVFLVWHSLPINGQLLAPVHLCKPAMIAQKWKHMTHRICWYPKSLPEFNLKRKVCFLVYKIFAQ